MKHSTMLTVLSSSQHTILMEVVHQALQRRDLNKMEHQALRSMYYDLLWATRVMFDVGANEQPHADLMKKRWDYSEYPIIKVDGKPLAHIKPDRPFMIDGVKNK